MFLQRSLRYSRAFIRPQAMMFGTGPKPNWLLATELDKIKQQNNTQFLALRMGNGDNASMNVRMVGGLEGNNQWFENYKISDTYEGVEAQNYKIVVVSSTPKDLANVTLDPEIKVGDGQELQISLNYNIDLLNPEITSVNADTAMTKMTVRANFSSTDGYPNLAYADTVFKKKV